MGNSYVLVSKFMNKYGINENDQVLETEIQKFLQGEKLTDIDLQRLDNRIKAIFRTRRNNQHLRTTLSQSLLDKKTNSSKLKPQLLPIIQDQKNQTLNTSINPTNQNLTSNQNTLVNNRNITINKDERKLRPSASMEVIKPSKKLYRNPIGRA